MLFVICILGSCIAAVLTRSKLYAIVIPSLVLPVGMTVTVFMSPGDLGEALILVSPFIVGAFLMALFCSSISAFVIWRFRGAPSHPVQPND